MKPRRYTSQPKGTRAHRARRIWDALVDAGERPHAIWFELLGRGGEMQGPTGGWFYSAPAKREWLGYDVDEALQAIFKIKLRNVRRSA